MHMYMHKYAYTYTCRKLHSNALPVLMSSQVYVDSFSSFFARLSALGSHLVAKLSQDGAKMAPRWFRIAPRWPNIAQHSAKMSQHSLQEQPQDPKKPSKVLYYRRFLGFRDFWQDRAQDPKKVAKMLPKVRQVGHLGLQVGHLGHILAPSWPTWRHLGAKMRPNSHPNGGADAIQRI